MSCFWLALTWLSWPLDLFSQKYECEVFFFVLSWQSSSMILVYQCLQFACLSLSCFALFTVIWGSKTGLPAIEMLCLSICFIYIDLRLWSNIIDSSATNESYVDETRVFAYFFSNNPGIDSHNRICQNVIQKFCFHAF